MNALKRMDRGLAESDPSEAYSGQPE